MRGLLPRCMSSRTPGAGKRRDNNERPGMARIVGTWTGNDRLRGTDGDDVMSGLGGDDV